MERLDLEAVIPLEERGEEKGWEPCKLCVHICPWILIRGGCMSWDIYLAYALVGRCFTSLSFLHGFFLSSEKKVKRTQNGPTAKAREYSG